MRLRRDLDQDIYVTIRAIVATRTRAKQRGVHNAVRTQGLLIRTQAIEDLIAVHAGGIAQTPVGRELVMA